MTKRKLWPIWLPNMSAAAFAVLLAGGIAAPLPGFGTAALAQSPPDGTLSAEVTDALGRMNKTLLGKEFSFQANTLRAYTGPNGELLHITHKIKTVVRRPDRLAAETVGDDGASKMLYDGKTLAIYDLGQKQY